MHRLHAVLFALAYTQPAAFYSNQHQYYLHAAAIAGRGDLANDWLANTTDPTPAFTHLTALVLRHVGEWPLQVVLFGLIASYYLAIRRIVLNLNRMPADGEWLFAGLFTLSHCAVLRYASDRFLGADYPWFLQCGLANQYLLGPGLQPSVFGVLLLWAVAYYSGGRVLLAGALAGLVNCVHATYLLPAALLVLGMMAAEFEAGRRSKALALGLLALAGALPALLYALTAFAPETPKSYDLAVDILANVRIPHHARPGRWFDIAGAGQIVLLFVGLSLLRRTALARPLLLAGIAAALLTGVAMVVENAEFSLTFPWRISAVLVPISTAAVCATVAKKLDHRAVLSNRIGAVFLLAAAAGAIAVYSLDLGYREPPSEEGVLEYVREHRQPGDVYLIPARFPKPNPPRGVYSATFAKPPGENAVVYFELARFRLATGARLFVDFKSIPYRDVEVLEWHRRVTKCVEWFSQPAWSPATVAAVKAEGITHVVAPKSVAMAGPGVRRVHEAGAYAVYALE
jgi:hypothetical protein